MAHYLQLSQDPIHFDPVSLVTNVFFDGTNNQVFAVRSGGETGVIIKGPASKNHLTFQMKDLGPLISIKFSIGQKILALQRKETSVEFSNFINGETDAIVYSQTCKGRTNKILTFHWVAADEIIFSTEQGIEYYQVNMEKRLLKLIKNHNIQTNWSVYSPTSSVLLVSTSSNANVLLPFHFKNGQVTKLQKFVVDFPQTTTQPNQQIILERDVTLLSIYNTLYAAFLRHPSINSPEKCVLVLYIVHRDIPVRKSFILRLGEIGRFAFNVVDNLVIAHHQFSKKSIMFDIKLPGISKSNIVYLDPLVASCSIKPYFLQNKDFPSQSLTETNETSCDLYATTWIVFQPNIIIDAALGCMWYVDIILDDVSSFFKEQSLFLDFLLLRKQSKPTIIKLCQTGLRNQLSLNQISTMFSKLNQVYKAYIEAEESFQLRSEGGQRNIVPHHCTLNVLDQNDLFTYILQPFIEDKHISNYYKISVLIDYLKSLDSFKINVKFFINKLLIDTLIQSERYFQLYQLLQHNVIEDCQEVAILLLQLDSKKPCFQLGLDMLKRLATSDNEVIEILLSKKLILPSLRFIRSVGMMDLVPARRFLQASMFDDMLFYSVYKLFETRNLRVNGKAEFKLDEGCDEFMFHYIDRFSSQCV